MNDDVTMYSPAEAAALLRVSERRLRASVHNGRGPKPVLLNGKILGFTPEAIRAWFDNTSYLNEDDQ